MLAFSLILFILERASAAPVHDIGVGLNFAGGKLELRAEYRFLGFSGQALQLSTSYEKAITASIKYLSPKGDICAFSGRGYPADSVALRYNPLNSQILGAPVPWTLSSTESGDRALGLRMGFLDSLIVFNTPSVDEPYSTILPGDISALAVQVSAPGKAFGGGLAFSAANLAREEYDEGWADGTLPSPGGLFATMAFSGSLISSNSYIQLWASFSAGLLESPGAAISLLGEWESPDSPRYALKVFSFLSLPGYRVWTGDALDWDLAISMILEGSWDTFSARIEGKFLSEVGTGNWIDWLPGRASIGIDFKGYGYSLSCEAGFSTSGLDIASVRLSRRFVIKAIPYGKVDLNLSAKTGVVDSYSTGFALGWKIKGLSSSTGKVSMALCCEPELEGLLLSLSWSVFQEIPFLGLGVLSLGVQSPEGGYLLGNFKFGLPDLALSFSLRFPPH